jgi:hypothetical protein
VRDIASANLRSRITSHGYAFRDYPEVRSKWSLEHVRQCRIFSLKCIRQCLI